MRVFTSDSNDIAGSSRHVSALEQVDDSDPAGVIDRLKKVGSEFESKPVLLVAADNFLQIVAAHRRELDERFLINLPASGVIDTVMDKGMFGEFTSKYELPAPRSWDVETDDDVEQCIGEAGFPVIIKPVFAHAAVEEKFQEGGVDAKMILVEDVADLRRNYSILIKTTERLLVQEYIKGIDDEHYSYCAYRNSDGQELTGVGVRKLRLLPIHAGAGTFVEISEDEELVEKSRQVIDALGYTGISSTCFKRNSATGKLVMHEVNGRFPAWHGISQLAGVELPLIAYQDMIGAPLSVRKKSAGNRKWIALKQDFSASREYRRAGELTLLQWLRSLSQVRLCAEFAMADPGPFFHMLKRSLSRAFGKNP